MGFSRWEKLSGVIAFLSPEDGAYQTQVMKHSYTEERKRRKKKAAPTQ